MTQEYIGTKQVTAWEQASPKKVKVCGIDCRKGESACNNYCTGGADRAPAHPAEPGYAVKYPDGYISWSRRPSSRRPICRLVISVTCRRISSA